MYMQHEGKMQGEESSVNLQSRDIVYKCKRCSGM